MGENTDVDVTTLEDFLTNLGHRRTQIETVVAKMNSSLKDKAPALGTFLHADRSKAVYTTHYGEFADRINRLLDSVVAAQIATATIIANYKNTEQRNAATAAAIGAALSDVDKPLTDGDA